MPKAKLKIIVKKRYFLRGMSLIKAREEAGLSQESLSQKTNNTLGSQQNISDIESSILLHQISTKAAKALHQVFDVHMEEHSI